MLAPAVAILIWREFAQITRDQLQDQDLRTVSGGVDAIAEVLLAIADEIEIDVLDLVDPGQLVTDLGLINADILSWTVGAASVDVSAAKLSDVNAFFPMLGNALNNQALLIGALAEAVLDLQQRLNAVVDVIPET